MVKPVTTKAFLGVNNKLPPEALTKIERGEAESFFVEAMNVDMNDAGGFSRRRGFSQVLAGACHSVWGSSHGMYLVCDGWLCRFINEDTVPIVEVSLAPVSYAQGPDRVFFSNGQVIGWLQGDEYGLYEQEGTYSRTAQFLDAEEEQAFYDTPPPGPEIEFFAGRLWVAAEAVWYSQAFFPERVDRRHNYLPWSGVTMLGAVADGLYLGRENEVWFLSGTDPKQMRPVQVCDYGAVSGTKVYANADKFLPDSTGGRVVLWESSQGKVLGLPGGQIKLLTDRNVSYAPGARGASLLRELAGFTQHVSTFPSGGEGSGMRASDTAIAEIRRNGVVI